MTRKELVHRWVLAVTRGGKWSREEIKNLHGSANDFLGSELVREYKKKKRRTTVLKNIRRRWGRRLIRVPCRS